MTPSIDVIVPVHNRWDLTEHCLEHLCRQTLPHTVIISDNGSSDGTPERLHEAHPEAQLVELGTNRGFPSACNAGVKAGSGEIVVLLNNDVDCRPDFLERLVVPLRDQRVGSVATLLLKPDEVTIDSFGLTVDRTLAGFPRLRGFRAEETQANRPILIGPAGAAGAYRRAAWEGVGGLDEGVLFYGEDVDLALRIRAAGWSAVAAPDAVAVHAGSATATHRSAWQRYQGGFSRGYFLRRYGVLGTSAGLRAGATEAIVIVGDALFFSHDLAAVRGRIAGWRAARGKPRRRPPAPDTIDLRIGFLESLRARVAVYGDHDAVRRSPSTSS